MTKHTLIPRPAYEPKSPKSPEPLQLSLINPYPLKTLLNVTSE